MKQENAENDIHEVIRKWLFQQEKPDFKIRVFFQALMEK